MAIEQKAHVDLSEQLWMPNTIGSTKKINDETPIELQEMAKAIESLPARYQEKVAPAMQRVVQCSTRRRLPPTQRSPHCLWLSELGSGLALRLS